MPLSEHEQRLFEQIERSLAEDPKFASAVRSTDPRFHARRRIVLAVAEDDVQPPRDLVDEVIHVVFEAAVVVAREK